MGLQNVTFGQEIGSIFWGGNMNSNEFESWEEFWDCYKSLQWYFMEAKKHAIVDFMEDIPKYVNGHADGWMEFKIRFISMEMLWPSQLQSEPEKNYFRMKSYLDKIVRI